VNVIVKVLGSSRWASFGIKSGLGGRSLPCAQTAAKSDSDHNSKQLSCDFFTHVSAKAASTALTCEDCGVRFISRLKYKIQAWRHVYDNLCIRLSLALVEAVLKKLALGK